MIGHLTDKVGVEVHLKFFEFLDVVSYDIHLSIKSSFWYF